MNYKNTLALVVIAIIAIGGLFFPKGNSVVNQIVEKAGAISSPEISSPYLKINGMEVWYKTQAFNNASTTRCAIQAPGATSTLAIDGIVKAATTTDYTLTIAKAATPYATTTLIRTETVTANTQVAFPTASSTYSSLSDTNRTFKPNEWLVVSTAGPTATAFDTGSFCSAQFIVGGY